MVLLVSWLSQVGQLLDGYLPQGGQLLDGLLPQVGQLYYWLACCLRLANCITGWLAASGWPSFLLVGLLPGITGKLAVSGWPTVLL